MENSLDDIQQDRGASNASRVGGKGMRGKGSNKVSNEQNYDHNGLVNLIGCDSQETQEQESNKEASRACQQEQEQHKKQGKQATGPCNVQMQGSTGAKRN